MSMLDHLAYRIMPMNRKIFWRGVRPRMWDGKTVVFRTSENDDDGSVAALAKSRATSEVQS